MSASNTGHSEPLLKVARGPVFSRSNVCHITFDVSPALTNPAIAGRTPPDVLVQQWCSAIENFFTQRSIPERVHVVPQHIADESNHMRWYISCVGVPPYLMPQLGRFVDQELPQLMKGQKPRDLVFAAPTHFEESFTASLNRARGRIAFAHSAVSIGGARTDDARDKSSLSMAC